MPGEKSWIGGAPALQVARSASIKAASRRCMMASSILAAGNHRGLMANSSAAMLIKVEGPDGPR